MMKVMNSMKITIERIVAWTCVLGCAALASACSGSDSGCGRPKLQPKDYIRLAVQREFLKLDDAAGKAVGPTAEAFMNRFPDCCNFIVLKKPGFFSVPSDPFIQQPSYAVRIVYQQHAAFFVETIVEFDACAKIIGDLRSSSTSVPESY